MEKESHWTMKYGHKWPKWSKLDLEIIKTNILSKIYDDRTCLGPFGFREVFSLSFSYTALF